MKSVDGIEYRAKGTCHTFLPPDVFDHTDSSVKSAEDKTCKDSVAVYSFL